MNDDAILGPEPTPTFTSPVAPWEDGELIPPVDVYPTPLPLDPLPAAPEVLAATGPFLAHPEIVGFIGFAILCLGLSLWAAAMFARSAPTKYRRSTQASRGVGSSPEADPAPFSNLLAK